MNTSTTAWWQHSPRRWRRIASDSNFCCLYRFLTWDTTNMGASHSRIGRLRLFCELLARRWRFASFTYGWYIPYSDCASVMDTSGLSVLSCWRCERPVLFSLFSLELVIVIWTRCFCLQSRDDVALAGIGARSRVIRKRVLGVPRVVSFYIVIGNSSNFTKSILGLICTKPRQ